MYLYELEEPYFIHCPHLQGLEFQNEWLSLHNGVIEIAKGYAWDGCSPKWRIWGKVIGIWDGSISAITNKPKTYYASLVHDALYQFAKQIAEQNGIKLKDVKTAADLTFFYVMKKHGFPLAKPYYIAVRILGGLFI